MKELRQRLSKFPRSIFTVITVVVILWLTLAPKPLGDDPPALFPGADKLAHALMFGFLTAMMLFDRQRTHDWKRTGWKIATLYAITVSCFGILIECAQYLMGLGRGFELWDIVADTAGAFLVAIIWIPMQKYWLPVITK